MGTISRLIAQSLSWLTLGVASLAAADGTTPAATPPASAASAPNPPPPPPKPAEPIPNKNYEVTCNGKAQCLIDDSLQIKRLLATDTPTSIQVLVHPVGKPSSEALFELVKPLNADDFKSGTFTLSLASNFADKIKTRIKEAGEAFWTQLATEGSQNKLAMQVQVTAKSAEPPQALTLDFSSLWSSGALQLQITSATCGDAKQCQLGDTLVLKTPALPFWLSATKTDFNKVSLAVNGTALPSLPKDKLSTSRASVSFTLERGLSPYPSVDPWAAVIKSLTASKASTEIALVSEQGTLLSNAFSEPGIKLVISQPQLPLILGSVVVILVFFSTLVRIAHGMVRDPLPTTDLTISEEAITRLRACMPYSLGRSQMLFWTLIVVASWAYLFFAAGYHPWTINDTALVLMGIGGATALGAGAANPALTADAINRAGEFSTALTTLEAKPDDTTLKSELAKKEKAFKDAVGSKNWWSDVTSDAGTSQTGLHRLQNLAFTALFGIYFFWNVLASLAMPVFPATALALLGISGGAYVGYKAADKK